MDNELLKWLSQVAPRGVAPGRDVYFWPVFRGSRDSQSGQSRAAHHAHDPARSGHARCARDLFGPVDWARMVLGELLVGLLMALSLAVVFEGMQFAGQLSRNSAGAFAGHFVRSAEQCGFSGALRFLQSDDAAPFLADWIFITGFCARWRAASNTCQWGRLSPTNGNARAGARGGIAFRISAFRSRLRFCC